VQADATSKRMKAALQIILSLIVKTETAILACLWAIFNATGAAKGH
jgi:hypothetical protein